MAAPIPQQLLHQTGLSGPLPGALADLRSLANDVMFTQYCALRYAAMAGASTPPEDPLMAKAFWFAGAISYRRAFTTGKGHLVVHGSRLKINEAWERLLTGDQRKAHNKTLKMANQHVAHRVAEHEGAVVVALLAPPPQPRQFLGVGNMLVHMFGPEVEVAQQIASVCDLLLGLFATEGERLESLIEAELTEADINELYEHSSAPDEMLSSAPGERFNVPAEDPIEPS